MHERARCSCSSGWTDSVTEGGVNVAHGLWLRDEQGPRLTAEAEAAVTRRHEARDGRVPRGGRACEGVAC